jgi:hypothetical protein
MRYFASLVLALVLLIGAFWIGSQIAIMVSQGSSESADFLRGRTIERCGYTIDARFGLAGYELDEWKGDRCEDLSELDRCVLTCLSEAGAVEIAADCFPDCVKH